MSDDLTPPHWNELPEQVAPAAVFPPPHCTAWEDCNHDGICHDPKFCCAIGPNHEAFYGKAKRDRLREALQFYDDLGNNGRPGVKAREALEGESHE